MNLLKKALNQVQQTNWQGEAVSFERAISLLTAAFPDRIFSHVKVSSFKLRVPSIDRDQIKTLARVANGYDYKIVSAGMYLDITFTKK